MSDSVSPAPDAPSIAGYKITGEIHRGPGAVTYEGIAEATKRPVAIKVFSADPFSDDHARGRVEHEWRILRGMKQAGMVAPHDTGTADGQRYCISDRVQGPALDAYMNQKGEWTVEEILALFGKICAAVQAAHLRGVTHRGLKPGNVVVDEDGEPHIVDFGSAVLALPQAPDDALPWASPEQVADSPEAADLRSDVYALGLLLFHLLTDQLPYDVTGDRRSIIGHIRTATPTKPGTLDEHIDSATEAIVLKCLNKKPAQRYQSVGELHADVERAVAGKPVLALGGAGGTPGGAGRGGPLVTVCAVIALLAIVAAVILGVMYNRESNARKESERLALVTRAKFEFARSTAESVVRETAKRLRAMPEAGETRTAVLQGAYRAFARFADVLKEDSDSPTDLADTYSELGDLAHELGIPDKAREHHLAAHRIRERLVTENPNDPAHQGNLAISLGWLGTLARESGNLAEAGDYLRQAASLQEQLARNNPQDRQCLGRLLDTNRVLGDLMQEAGNLPAADAAYRGVLNAAGRLLAMSPDDLAVQNLLALALEDLGALNVKLGKVEDARNFTSKAITGRKVLAARPRATADDYNYLAWILLTCEPADLREPAVAVTAAEKAVEMSADQTYILDTLALAYHTVGENLKAVETQQRALSLLAPDDDAKRAAHQAKVQEYSAAATTQPTTQPGGE
ncbi:MAG: serine/threonine-protein kinase [Planctomycetes bacterium]|nr:serine/threonine-protein kinase [Planctomycetota bacterium]